jgi:hypothetical protein
VRGDGRFVIALDRIAIGGDGDAAEADREPVAVRRFARLADRHDDAAPVGVLARDGGLDQRRVGDGQADAARAFVRGAPVTRISMNFCAPSPSFTTRCASWVQMSVNAA